MQKVQSLHSFTMAAAFSHEDEGTAKETSAESVGSIIQTCKSSFPGIVTARQLGRSLRDILVSSSSAEFDPSNTLLVTSFDGDEMNRDLEDELRTIFGSNYNMAGIAGFPFFGATGFGAMSRHIPSDGNCLIVFGPHTGIDFDGTIGKVNRKGHPNGSGMCCCTSAAAKAYVEAVRAGEQIHSPDPSDPIDAQQIFVNTALLKHAERLENAEDPDIELPHAIYDCQVELWERIISKCCADEKSDIPKGSLFAILGGIQVNTPPGTPEYFLPKKFELRNHKGEVVQDLLADLIKEGTIDVKEMIRRKKLAKMLKDEEMGLAVATQAQQKTSTSKKEGGLIQVNMLDIAKEQKLGSRNG